MYDLRAEVYHVFQNYTVTQVIRHSSLKPISDLIADLLLFNEK